MNKTFIYSFLIIGALTACEEIYTPEIDARENVMVVDARIVMGNSNNVIKLNKSHGYNDSDDSFDGISGADVRLVDNNGITYNIPEFKAGIYSLAFELNPELTYKLEIEYKGDIYESSFESVPELPDLDTVYGFEETKIVIESGENSTNDIKEKLGLQMYSDTEKETNIPYYRFTARKIMQYVYVEHSATDDDIIHYLWTSYLPKESFNIASPPDFSNSVSIIKHPLYFMEKSFQLETDNYFKGWILILNQFGISNTANSYYNDLNNQLDAEGRIFDPVYVQARNNLKCANNKNQLVLGNFEIATYKEHRFFVKFVSDETGYILRPITEFYDIPWSGETINEAPEWWQR